MRHRWVDHTFLEPDMAKFTSKTKPVPKAPPPPMGKKKMPERGQRTATHNDSKHPGSHDAWEKMGS